MVGLYGTDKPDRVMKLRHGFMLASDRKCTHGTDPQNYTYTDEMLPAAFRLCALVTVLSLNDTPAQDQPAFRTNVNLVNVTAVARSETGALLSGLNKEDFEVLEDNVPQEIKFFARRTELPLTLGLLIDVSGSQEEFLKQHNRDVQTFLQTVLRHSDQAFALCFGNHLRLVSDLTSSPQSITEGLHQFSKGKLESFSEIGPIEKRDGGTAFYDSIFYSVQEKLKGASERRKALLIFSDGEDNSSEHDLLDALAAAQDTDTLIYCIRYTHREHGRMTPRNRYGVRVMKHLAGLTGGADYDGLASELPEIFRQIGDELRSLYEIGYISSNEQHDGSFRKLTVRCKVPGTRIRAKSGFYAQ
jgi:Ca-activated chloride channel homolog